MKSFWICCGATRTGAALVLALLALHPAAAGRPQQSVDPVELTNFLLGPEYSQWLVGPISWIASKEEIRDYLRLSEDAAAAAFIEEFWGRRKSSESPWPQDQPRAQYESRVREADRLYSEGTYLGRRTDRGTIFVLFGAPEEIGYEVPVGPRGDAVEVWSYPKDAPKGLHGERPKRRYYFVRRGDRTVFGAPPIRRRAVPGF